jgi:hypothetical protein
MDLLNGDLIMSEHSFDETWAKVVDSLRAASTEQYAWALHEDRDGSRITADMEYKQDLRMRRRLLLEINFFPVEDNRIRLELHYKIDPMINIGRPKQILTTAVDTIAGAVSADQQIYSRHELPQQLAPVLEPAKEDRRLLAALEIWFVANFIIMFIGIFPAGLQLSRSLFQMEAWIMVPAIIIVTMGKLMKTSKGGRGGAIGTILGFIVCALFFVFVVLPILAFGLCVGILTNFGQR